MKTKHPFKGFTLLEVLVALAIFATTAMALMKIGMNYTQSIIQNQLRTQAHFVAMNVVAELQIEGKWITGTESHERDEQGSRWQVKQTAFSTLSPDVQRIEIQVLHVDENRQQPTGITNLSVFNYRQTQVAP